MNTVLDVYRLNISKAVAFELPEFESILTHAQATVHIHEYSGVAMFTRDAVHKDLLPVYQNGGCMPLTVNGKHVGLIMRLTRHTSSVAGIILTWTNESGREGDYHLHYILDNGVVASISTLYSVYEFEELKFNTVRLQYVKGVKWASIKNFVDVHYASPSRVVPVSDDMVRLDAFIPAGRRNDERVLWDYQYRGPQSVMTLVPNARRNRLLRKALNEVTECLSFVQ